MIYIPPKGSGETKEDALFFDKMHRHRHNANLGTIGKARGFLKGMSESSMTMEQRAILSRIRYDLDRLDGLVRSQRLERNGNIAYIKHRGIEVKG